MTKDIDDKFLIGKKKLINLLTSLYENKSLPNKILLSGNKGIGKFTLTQHFMNYIYSKNEDYKYDTKNYKINNKNKSFILFKSFMHPNIRLIKINVNKKFIDISQIRDILDFFNKSSLNSMPKFVLIKDVENLNKNSANSLLKILEEPNDNLFFILTHDSKKSIPDTITSRCIKFNVFVTDEEKIDIIDSVTEKNFFQSLHDDFKRKVLNTFFYTSLYNFLEKNEFPRNISIKDLLSKLFEKKFYKDDIFYIDNLNLILQLFFYNKFRSKQDITKNYSLFFSIIKKINTISKFNLDIESFYINLKLILNNER